MRTMGRRLSSPVAAGERRVECAYCGMTWYRSDCIRDMDGLIRCPDDMDGLSNVDLARENAAGALVPTHRSVPGGDW